MANKSTDSDLSESSDIVEAEALAWVAQLNGDEVTEKDLAAFREWVQRSPAHQNEIIALGEFWEDLNILATMDEPIRSADRLSKKLRKEQSAKLRRRRFAVPAALAAVVIALFTVSVIQPKITQDPSLIANNTVTMPDVYKTAVGEQQTHTLEDGSVITLNTNSLVEVNYSDNQRNLRLISGEALFTVATDKSRPFMVFAKDSIIRAVGTEFSVRLNSDAVDLLVSEGTVELGTFSPVNPLEPGQFPDLKPFQMASLGSVTAGQSAALTGQETSVELVNEEKMATELAWTDGKLVFKGESLEEVVAEMRRYTFLNITVDPDVRNKNVVTSFSTDDIDKILAASESSLGVGVVRVDNQSIKLVRKN